MLLTTTVPIVVALASGIGRFPVDASTSLSVLLPAIPLEMVVGVRRGSEMVEEGVKREGEEVREMEEGITVPVVAVRVREEERREVELAASSLVVLLPRGAAPADEDVEEE